nr:unnamed protein product [Spirometra erinaceieuropaei]
MVIADILSREAGAELTDKGQMVSNPKSGGSKAVSRLLQTAIISGSTTATISETDTDTADFSCPRSLVHSPNISVRSVNREFIAQRQANQCLEHPHAPTASASTALIAPAHSLTAWAY